MSPKNQNPIPVSELQGNTITPNKSFVVSWGGSISSRSNMNNPSNPYNHVGATGDKNDKSIIDVGDRRIRKWGFNNHSPQKDIQLALKSITHKTISSDMGSFIAGVGLTHHFESENESESSEMIRKAEELYEQWGIYGPKLSKPLHDKIANDLYYFHLCPVIMTHENTTSNSENVSDFDTLKFIAPGKAERFRYEEETIDENAMEVVQHHFYHEDWCFTGLDDKKSKAIKVPEIVSIRDYISESINPETKPSDNKKGFFVKAWKKGERGLYSSYVITKDEMFDQGYPIARWKSNSSINDIQNEFEASCVRTDFLRNGMHVRVIVKVYSMKYADIVSNDSVGEKWASDLEHVKNLQGSFNSGTVIVIPVPTRDSEKEGLIEQEKIDTNFDIALYNGLVGESRMSAMSAHGVIAPEFFGIIGQASKGLQSQGNYLEKATEFIRHRIEQYTSVIEQFYCFINENYGLEGVITKINLNLPSFKEYAERLVSKYMGRDEIREKIFNQEPWSEEEWNEHISQLRDLTSASSVLTVLDAEKTERELAIKESTGDIPDGTSESVEEKTTEDD